MQVIFSHGKESGPYGVKITAMVKVVEDLGLTATSLDYQGMNDPEARANKLHQYIDSIAEPFILAGSSMGAYVSLRATQKFQPKGLFLLAPAVYMPGYDNTEISPGESKTFVMHGWHDDIVPVENVIKFASEYEVELKLLADDHVLRNSLDKVCLELKHFLGSFAD